MNHHTQNALRWICQLLRDLDVPFQITGGLAARAYGASRPLVDIDLDIPDELFAKVKNEVQPYITFGPARYQDESWDLILMTLSYEGQLIDISGATEVRIFNQQTKAWENLTTDFSRAEMKHVFDIIVPVIAKSELIFYKKALARSVDLIDVQQIEQQVNRA